MKPSDLPDKWEEDADRMVEASRMVRMSPGALELLEVVTATMLKCADELRESFETRH